MSKLIRKGNVVIAILGNGQSIKRKNVSNAEFRKIQEVVNDREKLLELMLPEIGEAITRRDQIDKFLQEIDDSEILTSRGNSIFWDSISPLSLPEDFAKKVLEAEKASDKLLIETYRNFWILLSLNPDEECRKNLFWFLTKTDMKISKSGFFIAYRNACETNKETEDGRKIYTDAHSHTTRIIIGEPVTMDRDKTDRDSNNTCSKGLHLGANWWLEQNYYGDTGLVCLCNPAMVVAVPRLDEYGKLRTCEYIPIDYAHYDEDNKVIPYDVSDGFECKYVSQVIYEGLLNKEDSKYTIDIPEIPGINKDVITNNLLKLARECIQTKI